MAEEKRKYKVGLVQMSMGPEPEANLAAAIEPCARGGARRRTGGLPAGAL